MLVFLGSGGGEDFELLEEERVAKDALNRFDQIRFQRRRVLALRVPLTEKVAQRRRRLSCRPGWSGGRGSKGGIVVVGAVVRR